MEQIMNPSVRAQSIGTTSPKRHWPARYFSEGSRTCSASVKRLECGESPVILYRVAHGSFQTSNNVVLKPHSARGEGKNIEVRDIPSIHVTAGEKSKGDRQDWR